MITLKTLLSIAVVMAILCIVVYPILTRIAIRNKYIERATRMGMPLSKARRIFR